MPPLERLMVGVGGWTFAVGALSCVVGLVMLDWWVQRRRRK